MKSASLALCLVAVAGIAHADGPFSHTSDGVTPAIIEYDSNGFITRIDCIPGSNCAIRSTSAPVPPWASQYASFVFKTGPVVSTGTGSEHFAFGVRGNAENLSCAPPSIAKAAPFLGRGIALFQGEGRVAFENFTLNCIAGGGVAESTSRPIYLQPNTTYGIDVWASPTNSGYVIEKIIRSYDGAPFIIAQGDCLSQASPADAYKCAATSQDGSNANRAFMVSTTSTLQWRVSSWYLDPY